MTYLDPDGVVRVGSPVWAMVVDSAGDAEAVHAYLERLGNDRQAVTVVALTPHIRAVLKRRGTICATTLPFFDNSSHLRGLEKTAELTHMLDRDLRLDLGDGLQDVYHNMAVYYTHWYARLMLKSIEVLAGIHAAYPEAGLVCFATDGARHEDRKHLYPDDPSGFTCALAQKFCSRHQLRLEIVEPEKTSGASKTDSATSDPIGTPWPMQTGRLNRVFGRRPRLRARLSRLLERVTAPIVVLALKLEARRASVIIPLASPGLERPLQGIESQFPRVGSFRLRYGRRSGYEELPAAFRWLIHAVIHNGRPGQAPQIPLFLIADSIEDGSARTARGQFERALDEALGREKECFTHLGVSFLNVLQVCVKNDLLPDLVVLHRIGKAQSYALRLLRPRLALCATNVGPHHVLSKQCRMLDIPVMLIPIKALVRPQNDVEAMGFDIIGREIFGNDPAAAAAQTPLALDYMQYAGYTGEIVTTGPLTRARVDPAVRRQERQRFFAARGGPGKIIVYAPSVKLSHPFHVVQALDEVLESMADLIQATAGLASTYLVLRLQDSEMNALTRSDVETLLDFPQNVVISDTPRTGFARVLALADVLVSNASTTAEEAVLNAIPVVQYDKWARYNHLQAPVVHGVPEGISPAYYVTAQEELRPALHWVLCNHAAGQELPAEMLSKYVFQEDLRYHVDAFVAQALSPKA